MANLNKSLADELNQPTSLPTARSNKKIQKNKAQNPIELQKKTQWFGLFLNQGFSEPWRSWSLRWLCCSVPAVLPHVEVSSVGSTSLKVKWDALSPDQARGIITQYRLIYRRHGSETQHTVDLPGNVYEHVVSGMWTAHCSLFVKNPSVLLFRWLDNMRSIQSAKSPAQTVSKSSLIRSRPIHVLLRKSHSQN